MKRNDSPTRRDPPSPHGAGARAGETDAFIPVADANEASTQAHSDKPSATVALGQDTADFIPVANADPGATLNDTSAKLSPGSTEKPQGVGTPSSAGFRFRILRPHAKGGLGLVSVAEDAELHREVALKEIQERHAGNTDSQARFVMEAEITGGLEHPGIVPVYGLGTYADGRPFYAMRFIRGDSFADVAEQFHWRSREQNDPGKTAVELRELIGRFIDVCHAIEYAHSRGILHRDIKPANIMLGKYGETLVVDWGIAKVLDHPESEPTVEEGTLRPVSAHDTAATQMGTTVGTPQYMSPEQAAGKLDLLGPPSDVYSLGATLYFILTGRPAFDGTRIMELLRDVRNGDFDPPRQHNPAIAKPLNAICLKAMARDAADRYPSPRALSHDIEHWLADEPVTAYRENAYERAVRWLRHHRSWAQASLLTLVAVTVVSIAAAVLVNQARRESERQRALADESFRHARAAVNDFFTQVSENTLLDVPGMHPLRKDLLQVALDYELTFLKQRGDDPKLLGERAAAEFRVAVVTGAIKSKREALPLFDGARKIQEQLLATQPDDSPLRYALSNSYNEIGRVHVDEVRYDEALRWFQKSLALREQLVKDRPDNAEYQRKLASTYSNVGVLAKQAGRFDDALKDYRRANEIRARLVSQQPHKPEYRRDLARGYYNLGQLAFETHGFQQAAQSWQQAATVFDGLMVQYPLVTEYRQWLGMCYRLLGDLERQLGHADASYDALEKAREILQRLAFENPQLVGVAADLAATYSGLAALYESGGQPEEALPWVEQAAEVLTQLVQTNPDEARFRVDLAANLVRTGTLRLRLGKQPAALEVFQQALSHYRELADRDLQNSRLQEGVGTTLINIGIVQGQQDEPDAAVKSLEEARTIYEGLEQEDPEYAGYQNRLALCHTQLGIVQQSQQQLEAAFDSFDKARKIHERFLGDPAAAPHHRRQLADTLLHIAGIEAERERHDEALQTYRAAGETAQGLLDPATPDASVLALVGTTWHGRGSVLLQQDLHQASLAAYQEAVDYQLRAVEASQGFATYRETLGQYYADLALVQKQMGRPEDALATTLKRQPLAPDDPRRLYQIARDLAALTPANGNDLSDTERMERSKHIDLAIGVLAAAKRAGYDDWRSAEQDPALAVLRDQDAFRKLLPEGK